MIQVEKQKVIYGIAIVTPNEGRFWLRTNGIPQVYAKKGEAHDFLDSSYDALKKLFPEAQDFIVRKINSIDN